MKRNETKQNKTKNKTKENHAKNIEDYSKWTCSSNKNCHLKTVFKQQKIFAHVNESSKVYI